MRLIDAENIKRTQLDLCDLGYDICFDVILLEDIESAPTIEAESVRHGEWIEPDGEEGTLAGTCSACRWECRLYEDDVVGMPYCPNYGAKMDGGTK